MSRIALALLCLAFVPSPTFAEELCPGCDGSGRVGCPACAEPYGVVWRGKCKGCQGPWAQNRGHCNRCNGTGTCQDCRGRGQACMVCKGSGRVADGTAAKIREGKLKKSKERSAAALKKLDPALGSWKGRGVDERGKEYACEFSWERALGEWFRCSVDRSTKDGKTSESLGFLMYAFSREEYLYYLYFDSGKGMMLSGTVGEDGRTFLFPFEGNEGRQLRLTIALDPEAGKIATSLQRSAEEDWETLTEDESGRTGDSSLSPSKAEPGDVLKNWAGLLGSWEAETKFEGKTQKMQYTFESVLGGNWFRCRGKSDSGEFTGMLGCPADGKEFQYTVFRGGSGEAFVYNGTAKDGKAIEFVPQGKEGVRWTWHLDSEAGRMRGVVETKGEEGWNVVEESQAVRK